jgi:hypothetical protein
MLTLFSSYNTPKRISTHKHHQGVYVYTKVTKYIKVKSTIIYRCHNKVKD